MGALAKYATRANDTTSAAVAPYAYIQNGTEENERDLRVPDGAGVEDDRIAEPTAGAEEVPAEIERVGNHANDLYALGEKLAVVMRHVIDQRDRNQREGKTQRQRVQRDV